MALKKRHKLFPTLNIINDRIKNIQCEGTLIHDRTNTIINQKALHHGLLPFIPFIIITKKFNKFNRDDIKIYYSSNKE